MLNTHQIRDSFSQREFVLNYKTESLIGLKNRNTDLFMDDFRALLVCVHVMYNSDILCEDPLHNIVIIK